MLILITKNNCKACDKVKAFIAEHGVSLRICNVDEASHLGKNADTLASMLTRTGRFAELDTGDTNYLKTTLPVLIDALDEPKFALNNSDEIITFLTEFKRVNRIADLWVPIEIKADSKSTVESQDPQSQRLLDVLTS